MNSAALVYLVGFGGALLMAFYVFLSAPKSALNRVFGGMAAGVAVFLFLLFRQARAVALLEPVSALLFAAKFVFMLIIVCVILFAASFALRRRLVTNALGNALYHKGFLFLGALFFALGCFASLPVRPPPSTLEWRGAGGAGAAVFGLFFLGRAVLYAGMFRVSLYNMAEKIAEETDEALFLLTRELRVVWCNRAAEALMTRRKSALLGAYLDTLLSFSRRVTARWLASEPREGRIKLPDGERVPVSVNTSGLENRLGRTVGYAVVVRNVALRESRIEEIRQHRDELEELVNLKTRELNTSHLSLKKSKLQLSYLNKILLEVKEQESMHIARELNNNLVPALTEILMQARAFERIASADSPDFEYGRVKSEKVAALTAAAIASVTRISAGLPPPDVASGDLVSALTGLIHEFRAQSGIACDFKHNGVALQRLKEEMAIVAYRIVQESLTNAARHAGGDRIAVSLKQIGATLAVDVADNGQGMAKDKMETFVSTGLRGMKERAKSVSGTLEITSVPGKGTTVSFRAELRTPSVRL